MEKNDQHHTMTALPTGMYLPVAICRRLGRPQNWKRWAWEKSFILLGNGNMFLRSCSPYLND